MLIKKLRNKKLKYFHIESSGLSIARNFGIKKARSNIVVFTDDDCVVTKNWLKNISYLYIRNKNIIGIFGKILPYKKNLHFGETCPCIFLNKKEKILGNPTTHFNNIGFGNNMSFKKEIFEKIGYFKKWLGIGSTGMSGEDAEFALRCLINGYKLMYSPKAVVYHNRWLNSKELKKQNNFYRGGETACYSYFWFKKYDFAKSVVKKNFSDSWRKFKHLLYKIIKFEKGTFSFARDSWVEFYYRLRGFMLAIYYFIYEQIV